MWRLEGNRAKTRVHQNEPSERYGSTDPVSVGRTPDSVGFGGRVSGWRKHFHEFLYDVQRLLHQIKNEAPCNATSVLEAVATYFLHKASSFAVYDVCTLFPL